MVMAPAAQGMGMRLLAPPMLLMNKLMFDIKYIVSQDEFVIWETQMSYRSRRWLASIAFIVPFLGGCGPVSAVFHDPHDLPALAQDPRVRYDAHAEGYAARIARLLPAAMARVEATHGRPFGKPFVVAAYLDDEAYAAANGVGSLQPRGVTFFDRIAMSPTVWREEPDWLAAYLAHELSHEHLHSHLSALEYIRIPVWFVEGIAVVASDGGGAQRVSPQEAKAEIAAGKFIETPDEASLFANIGLKAPPSRVEGDDVRLRMHMAYRQAGLFVAFLREHNPRAFKGLMHRLLDGEAFKSAFETSYGESLATLRARFIAGIAPKSAARL